MHGKLHDLRFAEAVTQGAFDDAAGRQVVMPRHDQDRQSADDTALHCQPGSGPDRTPEILLHQHVQFVLYLGRLRGVVAEDVGD